MIWMQKCDLVGRPAIASGLCLLTLVTAAPCWAEDSSGVSYAPPPVSGIATPRTRAHGPQRHLSVAQGIEESVRRLSHGLDLNADQQMRLRQILVDQHRRVIALRTTGGSADVTSATLAIYDQSRARIRAMLNPDQLKKYPASVPRDQTAPAQADLQHWMQMQEAARSPQDGAGK